MSTLTQTAAAVERIAWSRMRERLVNAYGHDCGDYVADLRAELGDERAWRELCEMCILAEIPAAI